MAGDDIGDLTFEELRSLHRVEKSSGQLSEVRRDLYPAMISLQERHTRECERYASIDTDDMKYEAANEKRKKIISTSKIIVELRMNKVANMVLRSAMGALNSVDNLPPEERGFYEDVLESAKKLWAARTKKVKTVTYPDIVEPEKPVHVPAPEPVVHEPVRPPETPAVPEPVKTEMEPPMDYPDDMGDLYIPEEELGDVPPIPEEELNGEPATAPASPETDSGEVSMASPADSMEEDNPYADSEELVTIRMLGTLPSNFSGLDRDYSLKKEDIVRMPECIASILIRKNLAVKLSI